MLSNLVVKLATKSNSKKQRYECCCLLGQWKRTKQQRNGEFVGRRNFGGLYGSIQPFASCDTTICSPTGDRKGSSWTPYHLTTSRYGTRRAKSTIKIGVEGKKFERRRKHLPRGAFFSSLRLDEEQDSDRDGNETYKINEKYINSKQQRRQETTKTQLIKQLVQEISENAQRVFDIVDDHRQGKQQPKTGKESESLESNTRGDTVTDISSSEKDEAISTILSGRSTRQRSTLRKRVVAERKRLHQLYSPIVDSLTSSSSSYPNSTDSHSIRTNENGDDHSSSTLSKGEHETSDEEQLERKSLLKQQIDALAETMALLSMMSTENWSLIDTTIGGNTSFIGSYDSLSTNESGVDAEDANHSSEDDAVDATENTKLKVEKTSLAVSEKHFFLDETNFDSDGKEIGIDVVENSEEDSVVMMHRSRAIHDLFLNIEDGNFALTTLEANILLSRLVTTLPELSPSSYKNGKEIDGNQNDGDDEIASTIFSSLDDVVVIVNSMIQIYHEMKTLRDMGKSECGPDMVTFNILLHAMDRRFIARKEAVKIFQDMLSCAERVDLASNQHKRYNTPLYLQENFKIGMQACSNCGDLKVARDSLNKVLEHHNHTNVDGDFQSTLSSFRPQASSYLCVLSMLRKDNLLNEAIEVLDIAIKTLSNSVKDSVVFSLCRWDPKIKRNEKQMDPFMFFLKILDRLEHLDSNGLRSGIRVWSKLIESLARHAKRDESKWAFVERAFRTLWIAHPDCSPGRTLLKIGMLASEATSNAQLAAELISHEVADVAPSFFEDIGTPSASGSLGSPNPEVAGVTESFDEATHLKSTPNTLDGTLHDDLDRQQASTARPKVSPISLNVFRRAFEVCVRSGDMESSRIILHSFDKVRDFFPLAKQADMYSILLLGLAKAGETEKAVNLLESMERNQMNPSENLYGAILHSYACTGEFNDAHEMFDKMISNESNGGCRPGLSCYNAMLLTNLRSRQFNHVNELYETMKQSNIGSNSATGQALILASYGIGGKDRTEKCVQELLDAKVTMDRKCFELASKILISADVGNGDTTGLRESLRKVVDDVPHFRTVALDLIKSIRVAEVEEGRKPSKVLTVEQISQKREVAWRSAMECLARYVQAKNT